eukprot:2245266-Amphidinium_carterae.1
MDGFGWQTPTRASNNFKRDDQKLHQYQLSLGAVGATGPGCEPAPTCGMVRPVGFWLSQPRELRELLRVDL